MNPQIIFLTHVIYALNIIELETHNFDLSLLSRKLTPLKDVLAENK